MTDQLDMLAMLDTDTRAEREATEGVPNLFLLRCARPVDYHAAYVQWCEDYGNFDGSRISRAWLTEFLADESPTDTCQALVVHATLWCNHYRTECFCVGGAVYRGVCRGCPWEGTQHGDTDAAMADALDHSHPGWRALPVVESAPYNDGSKQGRRRQERWAEKVNELYGPQTEGCPIITDREPPGTRSVPDRSLWGGFDVASSTLRDLGDAGDL